MRAKIDANRFRLVTCKIGNLAATNAEQSYIGIIKKNKRRKKAKKKMSSPI